MRQTLLGHVEVTGEWTQSPWLIPRRLVLIGAKPGVDHMPNFVPVAQCLWPLGADFVGRGDRDFGGEPTLFPFQGGPGLSCRIPRTTVFEAPPPEVVNFEALT